MKNINIFYMIMPCVLSFFMGEVASYYFYESLRSSVTEKVKYIDQKIDTIDAKFEKLSLNVNEQTHQANNTLKDLSSQLDIFNKSFQNLSSLLALINHTNNKVSSGTICDPHFCESQISDLKKNSMLPDFVNMKAINDLISTLSSKDFFERKEAFETLSKIATPEAKEAINKMILDENFPDIELRRIAIESTDWRGAIGIVNQLIENTRNIDINGAAIVAAKNSNLSQEERESFENTITKSFLQNKDYIPMSAVIDYFSSYDANKFTAFLDNITKNGFVFSPELQDQINHVVIDFSKAEPNFGQVIEGQVLTK